MLESGVNERYHQRAKVVVGDVSTNLALRSLWMNTPRSRTALTIGKQERKKERQDDWTSLNEATWQWQCDVRELRKVLSELSISIGVHGFDHTSLVEDSTHAAEENVQPSLTQRRLHHIDDGANAPWKSRGRFLQELRGKCIIFPTLH